MFFNFNFFYKNCGNGKAYLTFSSLVKNKKDRELIGIIVYIIWYIILRAMLS